MNLPNLLKVLRDLGPAQPTHYALYKLGLLTGHYKRATSKPTTDHCSLITDHFPIPSRDSLSSLLGSDGQRSLLLEADEAVSGRFRIFGGDLAPIALSPPSLDHWTTYETSHATRHPTDLKLIWEPARFGWATLLARAYHLTQDDKYAAAFWTHFETFTAANPPYLGPNWISAQEAALRIIAWTFTWSLLRQADSTTEPRARALAESIAIHAERIPPTLVYARSQNNNHLLSEAAGLITAASVLPDHPRAQKWMSLGWKWFNRGLEKQIDGYGEYSQHSANYHRLMLQLALWVNSLITKGTKGHKGFTLLARKNLARASHWLASMLDSKSGGVPNLGANDGAYILPLTICPFSDFRPVVQAAARAFLNYDLPSGPWDEMALWFGNRPTGHTFEADHYLADNLRGRESWAYLRTTRFTSRPGHADLLHLDLWWRGLNIARDAGTFSYNAEPPWDNPLTPSRVHNTVTVDGRDQMTRLSRFLYVDWADAYAKTEIASDENVLRRVTAHHDGYFRLTVDHHRTVSVYADERWVVEDRLTSRFAFVHDLRLHWLLPDWEWSAEAGKQEIVIRLESPEGPIRLVVRCEAGLGMRVARARELIHGEGDVAPYEGWFSPTYGHKVPALSFAFETRGELPITFVSEFIFPSSSSFGR
jgi:hypothetical protein